MSYLQICVNKNGCGIPEGDVGYHFNSRLKLPDNRLPPRGPGKKNTDAEKKAIEDASSAVKEALKGEDIEDIKKR